MIHRLLQPFPLALGSILILPSLLASCDSLSDSNLQAYPADSSLNPSASPNAAAATNSPEVALAQHLAQTGAIEYGGTFCVACHDQARLFGEQANALLNIVQCEPGGENADPQRCREAQIHTLPTWQINGQFYPGVLPLDDLANLSGYPGLRTWSSAQEPSLQGTDAPAGRYPAAPTDQPSKDSASPSAPSQGYAAPPGYAPSQGYAAPGGFQQPLPRQSAFPAQSPYPRSAWR